MKYYASATLDLHGIDHESASHIVEKFITDNLDELPIKIITGYSTYFIEVVKKVSLRYGVFCYEEMFINSGCWIVINSPWIKQKNK